MNAVTVTVGATFFLPALNRSKYVRMLWCALRRRAFPVNRCILQFRTYEFRYAHTLPSAKPFSEVPKIRAFPLVGSSWMYLPILGPYHGLDMNAAASQMHRQYGPLVAEELPGRNFVVHLFTANDIRTLCQQETKMPCRMGIDPFKLYHIERPEYFSNCGILNAQGEECQHIRNMGQSSILRPRVIESFAKRIDKVTSDAVQLIASHRDHNGDVAGCFEILTRWLMETIVDVTLGRRLGLLENQLKSEAAARIMTGAATFKESMETLVMHFPYYRYFPTPTSWRWRHAGDIIAPIYWRVTKDAAEAARASNGKCKKSTVLQNLWSDNIEFKEMFTLLHDIIFAGIHTTSAMATYTLHCLAMKPKAQEMAPQEVGSLPEEVLSSTATVPYITACVKEALWLYPIVPGVNIKLRDDIVLSGYRIPKNMVVRTEQFVDGRLEENFNRASEFLPERWLRSAKQRKGESATEGEVFTTHPFGSLPFGFGPRSCLGKRVAELEVCTLVAKVLKKYKVENHHGDIGFRTMITAKPERPVNFRLILRALI